jgi:hypothetical protein
MQRMAKQHAAKWRGRFHGRALYKNPLGPALHQKNLNNYG